MFNEKACRTEESRERNGARALVFGVQLQSFGLMVRRRHRSMAEKFWISTGDISEQYETVNIVFAIVNHSILNEPVFAKVDPTKHLRAAIDELARQAQKLGANGVLTASCGFDSKHNPVAQWEPAFSLLERRSGSRRNSVERVAIYRSGDQ
jgi:hypothetical protein